MIKKLSAAPTIHENCRLVKSRLGEWTEIGANNLLENTALDDFSYTGPDCLMQNVVIGKFCNIAARVRIGATDHPVQRVSQHHFTYRRAMYGFAQSDETDFFAARAARLTTVGHDSWIGHAALIKPDVNIGNGAVIGQGSVVTKDVAPYAIVAGNPARLLRYRFDQATVKHLQHIAWWNWSYLQIKDRLDDFYLDVAQFIQKYR